MEIRNQLNYNKALLTLTNEIFFKLGLTNLKDYNTIYLRILMSFAVGFDIGRKFVNGSKPVIKMDRSFNILDVYPSMSSAAKDNNIGITGISKVCLEERNFAGGFRWRFVNPDLYYKKRRIC